MKYKALISFSGKVSMAMDEVKEILDQSIAKDLVKAGYVIPLESEKPTETEKPTEKQTKKKATKKKKGDK